MTAVDISTFLLIYCSSVILALAWVLLTETIASFIRARQQAPSPMQRPFRFAVLVPAHNEALVIEDTIARLFPQLSSTDRILVVADNCSDNTALLAEAAGAEVIHRNDRQLRGKGHALDCGIRHLAADPPDAVIIVDADCTVGPGCLREIAELCISRQRPVQARYEMVV